MVNKLSQYEKVNQTGVNITEHLVTRVKYLHYKKQKDPSISCYINCSN